MNLDKFDVLWKEMRAEVYAVQEWAQSEPDSDLRKRVFVRSMAAFIESAVNALADAMLEGGIGEGIPALYCILGETQFDLSDEGVPRHRTKQYPSIARWRFLVRVIEKTVGTDHWEISFSESGFSDLKELMRVRNRITHPRTSTSVLISHEEMSRCVSGYTWFVTNHQRVCKVQQKRAPL